MTHLQELGVRSWELAGLSLPHTRQRLRQFSWMVEQKRRTDHLDRFLVMRSWRFATS